MQIGHHDIRKRVLVVAEIGNNHEGNFSLAEELVGKAAESGADAVKFQTFQTEHYVSQTVPERFAMLKSFEFSDEEFANLKSLAESLGLEFISTPFDLNSVDTLQPLVSAYKVSSGDNTFYPLLEKIARQGKPIILSTGLAQIPQLKYAKALIEHEWACLGSSAELAVLHCVTSYPVPMDEANLAMIGLLRNELGGVVGYSDHTMGIDAAVYSVAAGARIVEKHFTIDHNYSEFRDHQLSADPDELKCLVEKVREVESLLGPGEDILAKCELGIREAVRRSVVALHPLQAGHTVTPEDITWVRPGGGCSRKRGADTWEKITRTT